MQDNFFIIFFSHKYQLNIVWNWLLARIVAQRHPVESYNITQYYNDSVGFRIQKFIATTLFMVGIEKREIRWWNASTD